MGNYYDVNEFEKFPYAELTQEISRKQFFQSMRKELNLLANSSVKRKIPELGLMDEYELSKLVPRIIPGTKISFQNNCVYGTPSGSMQNKKLFVVDPLSLQVFNKINGHKTIGRITTELSLSAEMEPSRAFLFVRGLFLKLVVAKVCLPINIPITEKNG